MLRFRTRLMILCVVCAVALSAGVQWAQAEAKNWCRDKCDLICEGSGGCNGSQAAGCDCFFFCGNGREGVTRCGQ